MFSTLEASAETRRRRGVALVCGAIAEVLGIVLALLLGVMFPQELPLTHRYVLAWLPALTPPKPQVVQPPRKVARVVMPKLKAIENPKLIAPPVAEVKVPKIQPTISAVCAPSRPHATSAGCTAQPTSETERASRCSHRAFWWRGGKGHHEAPGGTGADGRVWESARISWPRRKVTVPATSRSWDPLAFRKAPVWETGRADVMVFREWWPAPVLAAGWRAREMVRGAGGTADPR